MVEQVHGVVHLLGNVGHHALAHVLTDLCTGNACLGLEVGFGKFCFAETLYELSHILGVHALLAGEVFHKAFCVETADEVGEGLHVHGVHLFHLSLLVLLVFLLLGHCLYAEAEG